MTTESLAVLLGEISAGGKVVLADLNCACRDEDLEQIIAQHRRAYLFARKTVEATDAPTYSRVSVVQARVLIAAGAEWVGIARRQSFPAMIQPSAVHERCLSARAHPIADRFERQARSGPNSHARRSM